MTRMVWLFGSLYCRLLVLVSALPFLVQVCLAAAPALTKHLLEETKAENDVTKRFNWPINIFDLLKKQIRPFADYSDEEANRYVANGIQYMIDLSDKMPPVRGEPRWAGYSAGYFPSSANFVYGIDEKRPLDKFWRFAPLIDSFDSVTREPNIRRVIWSNGQEAFVGESPDRIRFDFFGQDKYHVFLPTAIVRPAVKKDATALSFRRTVPFYSVYEYPTSFPQLLKLLESKHKAQRQYFVSHTFPNLQKIWLQGLTQENRDLLIWKWQDTSFFFKAIAQTRKLPLGKSMHEFMITHQVPGFPEEPDRFGLQAAAPQSGNPIQSDHSKEHSYHMDGPHGEGGSGGWVGASSSSHPDPHFSDEPDLELRLSQPSSGQPSNFEYSFFPPAQP